jgi:hypothetical protein
MSDDLRAQAMSAVFTEARMRGEDTDEALEERVYKALRVAVEAERRRIAERLSACFEPTAPAVPIFSELARTALDIIQEGFANDAPSGKNFTAPARFNAPARSGRG